MTVLRAGLLGLGMMGRNHARVLASLDGVELVGIADPTGGVAGAAPHGVPLVDDLDELLALGIDYAVVSTPTRFHRDAALILAPAGVHCLIEKPLTTDVESAREVAEAFSAAGLVGAVGHIERYNPALQQARRRIADGDLGEIYQITTRRQGPFPGRIADVGVVLDLATHDIDLTAWVAQQPYHSVAARTAFRSGRPHEDLVAITGRLADGTVTNHLVNWLSPMKERVTVITGEEGAFVADTLSADLTFYENGVIPTEWGDVARFRGVTEGNMTRFAYPKPEPLRVEHENFRDAVLGRGADIVTLQQAAATVAVANAVAESAATDQVVRIEGFGVKAP
ncbi:MAG TPA: Gfo/Idh/MocA family oxidoreductase [Actinomycetota bacterium]|nr:Gfo/Idh/MocA family oxidoreductase [Actinomycetota bacterium]